MKLRLLLLSAALLLSQPSGVFGQLSLPHFFSDNMILQRDRAAAIWGKAAPDAEVNVAFKGKTATVKTDAEGNWRTEIETGAADAKGAELKVTSGEQTLSVKEVLVGEVWLASGQSNMFFTMNRVPAYEAMMSKADYPALRMFNAPLVTAEEPQQDIAGEWSLCSPETVPGYSAVAFFFALKLHQELGVPVGVLKTCWGGKPVETFTSREALNTLPGTKLMVDQLMREASTYHQATADAQYEKRLADWKALAAAEKEKPAALRKRLPKKPAAPKPPLLTEGKPGVLFNAMIHPFVGYTLRGAIWYQGEGNAKASAVPYDQTLPLMIRDWRERWGDDFSFYFAQLANYRAPSTEPGTQDYWALLQDRMRLILDTTPKTGMAVINDVGEVNDIHPKDKMTPGYRLARWALAKDYGKDLIYSSPLYKSSEVKDGAMEITFNHVGTGLSVRGGGDLKRFEISGAERVWHWADAKIQGKNSVLVSSPKVKEPVAVRYAWASNPEGANLINSEDLPASVFRTDDWDDVEPKEGPASAKGQEARRAKAAEIRALNQKLSQMEKGSPEFLTLRKKIQGMLVELKAMAGGK